MLEFGTDYVQEFGVNAKGSDQFHTWNEIETEKTHGLVQNSRFMSWFGIW